MFELAWPWMLLTLPLPWLARRLLGAAQRRHDAALRVPDLADFETAATTSPLLQSSAVQWLALAAWVLLVVASANPRWLDDPVGVTASGRDLMLVIDLSESMQVKDFLLDDEPVDRLTALKKVAREFIERRIGDRVGLVLFGERAYLNVPLTFDRPTVMRMLEETEIGLAGRSTAIGDAIGLAAKRLRDQAAPVKTIILMTDGANTSGQIDPLRAAKLAQGAGLRIYTIGIGADEMVVNQLFGRIRVNPSQDLDEDTLRAIAKETGGRYFRARDVAELEQIYAELDRLEPVARDEEHFRPVQPLYAWPLAAAVLLAGALAWRHVRRPA
ncbi:MAG TPA: VWA domain-containing protein [Gammaproteobacteria bacterium]|nr:VWA domain-containing protein [Gammaproteobacteria bacterium]